MSDLELRQAERSGDTEALFRARYRARQSVPLYVHRPKCTKCSGDGRPYKTVGPCRCQPCHTVSIADGRAEHVALLAAYADLGMVQEATGLWHPPIEPGYEGHDVWYPHVGRLGDAAGMSPNFSSWVGGFDRLLEKPFDGMGRMVDPLPPVVVDGASTRCRKCAGTGDEHRIARGQGRMGYYYDGPKECSDCNSTGTDTRHQKISFADYAVVLFAWEDSREARD